MVLDAAVPAVLGSLPVLMANLSAQGSWKPPRGQMGRMIGRAHLGCRGGGSRSLVPASPPPAV